MRFLISYKLRARERRGRTTTVQQENKNITKCGCTAKRLKNLIYAISIGVQTFPVFFVPPCAESGIFLINSSKLNF